MIRDPSDTINMNWTKSKIGKIANEMPSVFSLVFLNFELQFCVVELAELFSEQLSLI